MIDIVWYTLKASIFTVYVMSWSLYCTMLRYFSYFNLYNDFNICREIQFFLIRISKCCRALHLFKNFWNTSLLRLMVLLFLEVNRLANDDHFVEWIFIEMISSYILNFYKYFQCSSLRNWTFVIDSTTFYFAFLIFL